MHGMPSSRDPAAQPPGDPDNAWRHRMLAHTRTWWQPSTCTRGPGCEKSDRARGHDADGAAWLSLPMLYTVPRAPLGARTLPHARVLPAELARRRDHVLQRRRHFGPRARLEPAIRVDPHALGGQDLQRRPQRRHDLLLALHARRGDVVDAGADALVVARVAEDAQ